MLAYSIDGVDGVLDSIVGAAGAAIGAVKSAATTACGIVQNPSVQQAANIGALVAGKNGAQITSGQNYANGICSVVKPAPTYQQPAAAQTSSIFTAVSTAAGVTKPAAAAGGRYKAGSMARFNRTRGVWSVYSPLAGAGLFGVISDGRCMGGVCLGDGEVDPPIPAGFVKAGEELAPPAGVVQAGEESDKKPLYKNPYFWLAVGGGVAAVGGGVLLLRRRRA